MIHLGDITKIDGHKVPLVDVVTGGSPCQDLSVAGKRAGLAGERSGLFMEQMRIIKEMRDESTKQLRLRGADVNIRDIKPRYMVWENVPGAFSSNKGEDFRAVLEETAKIVCEDAIIPRPENEKWTPSGCIMGDGWSIAWRVHDAQFWGVPQRRKRIALVADFGGDTAPEILFERKSVSGDIEKSREKGEGIATNTKRSIDKAIGVDAYNQTTTGEKTMSITGAATDPHHIPCVVYNGSNDTSPINASNPKIDDPCHTLTDDSRNYLVYCLQGNGIDRADTAGCNGKGWREDQCYTLNTIDRPAVYQAKTIFGEDIAGTLVSSMSTPTGTTQDKNVIVQETYQNTTGPLMASGYEKNGTQEAMNDMYVVSSEVFHCTTEENKTQTLKARDYKDPQIVYGLDRASCNSDYKANISVVRRLTPLECERLQGFPDHWTDIGEWIDTKGKKHKDADSPRYKALGNSIALPFWAWMAKRMVQHLDTDKPTMASLFDGISGFPLVYARAGVETKWTSEIEEFPIAVCKKHFGDEDTGEVGDYEKYL